MSRRHIPTRMDAGAERAINFEKPDVLARASRKSSTHCHANMQARAVTAHPDRQAECAEPVLFRLQHDFACCFLLRARACSP
jgi:hypothetical protein